MREGKNRVKILAVTFGMLLVVVLGVATIASGPHANAAYPSVTAATEIPADLLPVYIAAAGTCPGLPWSVLAAVGWIESGHAQHRADPTTGEVYPPIVGPALDGTNGFAYIRDTNEPDGYAHAHGPMQFLLSTWTGSARLAPGRPTQATPSPDNAWDAIYTAAAYLCGGDGPLADIEAALFRYNPSRSYVADVLAKAAEYGVAGESAPSAPLADGMYCPVAGPVEFTDDWGDPRSGGRSHKGNDLFADHGTPLVAIEDGVITSGTDTDEGLGGISLWLTGSSGTDYYYAHNANNAVSIGSAVRAGQVIAYVGNTGNARTTASHLHLQVHPGGGDPVDPFPLVSTLCVQTSAQSRDPRG